MKRERMIEYSEKLKENQYHQTNHAMLGNRIGKMDDGMYNIAYTAGVKSAKGSSSLLKSSFGNQDKRKNISIGRTKSAEDSPSIVRVRHQNLINMIETESLVAIEHCNNGEMQLATQVFHQLQLDFPDVLFIAKFWEGLMRIHEDDASSLAGILIQAQDYIGPNRIDVDDELASKRLIPSDLAREWKELCKIQLQFLHRLAGNKATYDFLSVESNVNE